MTTTDLINEWRKRTNRLASIEYWPEADKFIERLICHIRNEHVVMELMPRIPDACFDRFQDEVS